MDATEHPMMHRTTPQQRIFQLHLPSVFTAALVTIADTWDQQTYPLTHEWMRKMWYISMMEDYSVIKKNELLSCAATWMELEDIVLSETSQANTPCSHSFLEAKNVE